MSMTQEKINVDLFDQVRKLQDKERRMVAKIEQLRTALSAIEERYTDGSDTYDDWQFMGETARRALEENENDHNHNH